MRIDYGKPQVLKRQLGRLRIGNESFPFSMTASDEGDLIERDRAIALPGYQRKCPLKINGNCY